MRGGAHKSCLNVQFITRNQADMNSTEITNVIGASALYLSALALFQLHCCEHHLLNCCPFWFFHFFNLPRAL